MRLSAVEMSAIARVFLARWYRRTAPPPPCETQYLHGLYRLGCPTCRNITGDALRFAQSDVPGSLDELRKATEPWWRAVYAINRKYNFSISLLRSSTDHDLWEHMYAAIWRLHVAYDAAHPVPPCPSCGGRRLATTGGGCSAFGRCALGPEAIGG